MKILHTADLHLAKGKKDRLDILRWIMDTGNEKKVDLIIIAGDLFDSDADASILRSQVRDIFKTTPALIMVIPGNHDARSYGKEYNYGDNVLQATTCPYQIEKIQELHFAAIPFQEKSFNECVQGLPGMIDVIIAHGTLYDPAFMFAVLDDTETEYMPIFPDSVKNRARYVALGHIHSRYAALLYGKTHVVYPGSPIALDTKCIQPRACALIDITGQTVATERLEVDIAPYWDQKDFFVFPGNEESVISGIREYLKTTDPHRVLPHITVRGYIGTGDKEYHRTLDTIATHFKPMFTDFALATSIESWDTLLQHRMVQRFIEKTEQIDEALRMKLYAMTFPILSKVLK